MTNETRWPKSSPAHVQPYNDAVLADLESIMRDVVTLADSLKMSGVELLNTFTQARGGDVPPHECQGCVLLEALLNAHTTPELDADDLAFELIELAGAVEDDNFNE